MYTRLAMLEGRSLMRAVRSNSMVLSQSLLEAMEFLAPYRLVKEMSLAATMVTRLRLGRLARTLCAVVR